MRPMSDHSGLPQPFRDEHGFPICLLRIRAEIRARGGEIVGDDLAWLVTHPDHRLPDIDVIFDDEGELLIKSGDTLAEFSSTEKWWEPRNLWYYQKSARYGANRPVTRWRELISGIRNKIALGRRRNAYLATDPPTTLEYCLRQFLDGAVIAGSRLEGRVVTTGYPAWPANPMTGPAGRT
jgi:hypothetical protein